MIKILTAPFGDRTLCIHFIIDEADVETNLAHADMMVGSDGIPDLRGKPHPRLFWHIPSSARSLRTGTQRAVLARSRSTHDILVRQNLRTRRERGKSSLVTGQIYCCFNQTLLLIRPLMMSPKPKPRVSIWLW